MKDSFPGKARFRRLRSEKHQFGTAQGFFGKSRIPVFGTYNGKPKKEKSAEEKEAEELGSLFPENDEVKEEEKRKNREAEERIQRKKDERQRILSERAAEKERREKRKKTGMQENEARRKL